MRLAVSGTHCSGKTTLVEAFLLAHPDYAYEPEPYTVLVEEYGEDFSADPSADDFIRQLEFIIDRLHHYQPGDRVIFERSPVDFLAYLLALQDLHREAVDPALIESTLGMVAPALACLDLIVFLPLDDADPIDVPDDEDPELRLAVDRRLSAILSDNELGLFGPAGPIVFEVTGSTVERLRILEGTMDLS